MEDSLSDSKILGAEKITAKTMTTDNEDSVATSADFLTNYDGYVRCIVDGLAICVNEVFTDDSDWNKLLAEINQVTSYFDYHLKANDRLLDKEKEERNFSGSITKPETGYTYEMAFGSRAMVTYLTKSNNIAAMASEFVICAENLPQLSEQEVYVLE